MQRQDVIDTPDHILDVRGQMADHADAIKRLFKPKLGALVAIVVRIPDEPDMTLVLTDDRWDEVAKSVEYLRSSKSATEIPPDVAATN